ncbi:glycosyltransferase family 2 protein [Phycobacter sp. K97]|uniref:glycosyltransferase family 2 protein n=1 Tax=Phycobacter sedimenti TaxID=3133977 RepID=UPI00311FE526
MPEISVCIPAYAMGGHGAGFLAESLQVLSRQTHPDFEVVVSDQSEDTAVAEVCARFAGSLAIRHIWNRDGLRQASANVNFAMDHANGDILKILFQDDYLNGDSALQDISDALAHGSSDWLLCGSGISRNGGPLERPMVPRLGPKLHFGKNTVSSPSVLAMRRDCTERFDENLIWLMDVDFYKRLWDAHGDPVILPAPLVVNRVHDGQVSAGVSKALRQKELRYILEKFKGNTRLTGHLEYLRQRLKAL